MVCICAAGLWTCVTLSTHVADGGRTDVTVCDETWRNARCTGGDVITPGGGTLNWKTGPPRAAGDSTGVDADGTASATRTSR